MVVFVVMQGRSRLWGGGCRCGHCPQCLGHPTGCYCPACRKGKNKEGLAVYPHRPGWAVHEGDEMHMQTRAPNPYAGKRCCDGKYGFQRVDDPYHYLDSQIESRFGIRHDAYNQPPHMTINSMDRYFRSGANLSPEDIAEAERESWFTATQSDCTAGYNTEEGFDPGSDTMQYYNKAPAIDWNTYAVDLIVDPRMRENHRRWVKEMQPWSGVSKKVDTLEVENYTDRTGIRSFSWQPPAQHNPLQLTEVDSHDFARGFKSFRFNG